MRADDLRIALQDTFETKVWETELPSFLPGIYDDRYDQRCGWA